MRYSTIFTSVLLAITAFGMPYDIAQSDQLSARGSNATERSDLLPRAFQWESVDWPVGDKTWKEVDILDITRYRVYEDGGLVWPYVVEIDVKNTGFFTEYGFEDQSGGKNFVQTPSDGVYPENYRAELPKIKRVGRSG
ncbi:hypothetical protein C8J56DRAFT_957269 [Mycena floridula]|nr:hypothetical protein C8J56DRAFT_957269 [Mycena floridula]